MIALGLLVALEVASPAPKYRCPDLDVVLTRPIDTKKAVAGDPFFFKTSTALPASDQLPEIPAGTKGYGLVAFADHAHGSGQAARLVLEPRFLALPDGTHVQVVSNPQFADAFVEGTSHNVSGALQYIPVIGFGVGGYNALHRGGEVTLEKGAKFRVLVGDDVATGACFVTPPDAPNVR